MLRSLERTSVSTLRQQWSKSNTGLLPFLRNRREQPNRERAPTTTFPPNKKYATICTHNDNVAYQPLTACHGRQMKGGMSTHRQRAAPASQPSCTPSTSQDIAYNRQRLPLYLDANGRLHTSRSQWHQNNLSFCGFGKREREKIQAVEESRPGQIPPPRRRRCTYTRPRATITPGKS